jgi:cyclophilin family peptidyl-prolyl cis-trans isomerase
VIFHFNIPSNKKMKKNSKVFLDIIIGTKAAGRVTIELFEDLTPFTCENFRGLCTGDYGKSSSGQALCYQDSLFFKLIPNKYLIGGDIISNTGKTGESIYGKTFVDESFSRKHSSAGLLSTYSKGPNTNSSSFIITLSECEELDGKSVVFGQVVEGLQVLKTMEKTPIDSFFKPKVPIRVFNCGQLGDGREHVKFEEFRDQIKIYRAFEEKKAQRKEEHLRQYYQLLNTTGENQIEIIDPQDEKNNGTEDEESEEFEEFEENQEKISENSLTARLAHLKKSLKQAKKANQQAVLEEDEKNINPSLDKKRKKQEWLSKEKKKQENLEILGISTEKAYLTDSIAHAGNVEKKKRKRDKRSTYGWEVFNTDAHLRAYKKRVAKLETDKTLANQQSENPTIIISDPVPEKIEKMAAELEAEAERKNKFSRRRGFNQDLDVSYINERNRVYNLKLDRTYKDYVAEIKRNLERGTSI